MGSARLRNHVLNVELNDEFEEIKKEVESVVRSGFQKILGRYAKLYISNVPCSYHQADLINMFKHYGPIFAIELTFRKQGCKGFAYLTMYREDAHVACRAYNEPKTQTVKEAAPNNGHSALQPQAQPFMPNFLQGQNLASPYYYHPPQ